MGEDSTECKANYDLGYLLILPSKQASCFKNCVYYFLACPRYNAFSGDHNISTSNCVICEAPYTYSQHFFAGWYRYQLSMSTLKEECGWEGIIQKSNGNCNFCEIHSVKFCKLWNFKSYSSGFTSVSVC